MINSKSNAEIAKTIIKKWYVTRKLLNTLKRMGVISDIDISLTYELFCNDLLPYFKEDDVASMGLKMIHKEEQQIYKEEQQSGSK